MTWLDEPLVMVSTSTATTFNFRGEHCAWACCTVNDATGELAITSDWGNYAHRWNIDHLGKNHDDRLTTLTEFISGGSIEYLADKLMSREQRDRFDADATVAEFRKLLRDKRREAKRLYAGLPRTTWWSVTREGVLDKDAARRLWDAVESLAVDCENTHNGGDWFVERYFSARDMEGASALVCDEPWNLIRTKPSGEYLALTKLTLPALVEACKRTVASARQKEMAQPGPRSAHNCIAGRDRRCDVCGLGGRA